MKNINANWIKFEKTLSEFQKRWLAGLLAMEIGYGGVNEVAEAMKISPTTVIKGKKEVTGQMDLSTDRIRNVGGGRKNSLDNNKLIKSLDDILFKSTGGDPMSALIWTSKSCRIIAEDISKSGHVIDHSTVHRLLQAKGYSLQSNRKELSRENNPDRNRQFEIINSKIESFIKKGFPVISVDTKKKEIVGNFKNHGEIWRKKGDPLLVEDHDFLLRGIGKAVPYGTYDIQKNNGFVNVGISTDTAEFAVNSIKKWWSEFGIDNYPNAQEILICADGGGSNSSNNRLWKYSLQKISDQTGLKISVAHYPPKTSKWNKIEHRMFSYISSHWKGRPLESFESVVNLIGSTTITGLKIKAKLDKRQYKKGKIVTDEQYAQINIERGKTLPKWNYTICPTK